MPIKIAKSPAPAPPKNGYGVGDLAAALTRMGAGWLGIEGGPPGAAIGASGEALAQQLEQGLHRPSMADVGKMGVAGGVSAIPGAKLVQGGKAIQSAVRSGALAGLGNIGNQMATLGSVDPRNIDYRQTATSAGIGVATGGILGKLLKAPNLRGRMDPEAIYQGWIGQGEPPESALDKMRQGVEPPAQGAQTLKERWPVPYQAKRDMPIPVHEKADQDLVKMLEQDQKTAALNNRTDATTDMQTHRLARDTQKLADRRTQNQKALDAIERLREEHGLTKVKAASGTNLKGATDTGTETAKLTYSKPKPPKAGGEPTDLPTLLGMKAEGSGVTPPPPPATPAPPAEPTTPFNPPRIIQGAEAPLTGKSAALSDTSNGADKLEAIYNQIHGEDAPTPGNGLLPAEPSVPAGTGELAGPYLQNGLFGLPAEPSTPAEPLSFFKSRVAALGPHYDALQALFKGGGDIPPEAPRIAGRGLAREARAAGLSPTRMAPEAPVAPPAPNLEPHPFEPLPGEPIPQAPSSGMSQTSAAREAAGVKRGQLASMKEDLQRFSGLSPEERAAEMAAEPSSTPQDFLTRLRGQSGAADPRLLLKVLGAGGGAAVGASTDQDHPLRGALIGGALGAGAGFAPELMEHGMPSMDEVTSKGGQLLKDAAQLYPSYQRFNLLSSIPGLIKNAMVAPYGSGITGGIEQTLLGNPEGPRALKSFANPLNYLKKMYQDYHEADRLVGNASRAESRTMGEETTPLRKFFAFPGTYIASGDAANRDLLGASGMSEPLQRQYSLTSEPFTKFGKKLVDIVRGSYVGQTFLPFVRTATNAMEQGALRTPGLGSFVNMVQESPDNLKTQLVKQGLGLGYGLAGYGIGANTDPTQAKLAKSWLINASGVNGVPMGLGMGIGMVKRMNQPWYHGLATSAKEAIPLPTTQVFDEASKFLDNPGPSTLPQVLYPKIIPEVRRYAKKLGVGGSGEEFPSTLTAPPREPSAGGSPSAENPPTAPPDYLPPPSGSRFRIR